MVVGTEKEETMEVSGVLTSLLVTIENPLSIIKKHVKIAKEIGDRGGEVGAYGSLGNSYQSLGDYWKAMEYHEKQLKNVMGTGEWMNENFI